MKKEKSKDFYDKLTNYLKSKKINKDKKEVIIKENGKPVLKPKQN